VDDRVGTKRRASSNEHVAVCTQLHIYVAIGVLFGPRPVADLQVTEKKRNGDEPLYIGITPK